MVVVAETSVLDEFVRVSDREVIVLLVELEVAMLVAEVNPPRLYCLRTSPNPYTFILQRSLQALSLPPE